jgi:hypothetical protein
MKQSLPIALLALSLAACQKEQAAEPTPTVIEYADWYALLAPDNRTIEAVAGDLDGTLTITTRYTVYPTKDRGKTWQTGNYADRSGIFGFQQQQDSLLALTAGGGTFSNTSVEYAIQPSAFSLNQGLTWQHYRDWRPSQQLRVGRNRATAASGTEYRIEYEETPVAPNASNSYIESVAIQTSTGRRLTLPRQHQLTSLYFDAKSRLYVTASAPLCGRGKDAKICDDPHGILYVSKTPQR